MKLYRKTKIFIGVVFLVVVFMTGFQTANAATRTWDGGGATSNWTEAANWSADTLPTSVDDVVFNAASIKDSMINATITVSSVSINSGYSGILTQGSGVNLTMSGVFTIASGSFIGSNGNKNFGSIAISGGDFQGGTGMIVGPFGSQIQISGGAFSSNGDVEITSFNQSGGIFNAPSGMMTVSADFTHTAGGTFNAGTGTVKFTGYNTFNCINSITINVAVSEIFNNLTVANSFCNTRYISAGDTLIVNGDFRISNANIGGTGRIRPLGTTTIDATNTTAGGPTVEYLAPNTAFVIGNPASTVKMFPVELNAANSTLTSSGAGKIDFTGMTLLNGTINQANTVWDFTAFPGYTQSGGIFNGSAAQVNFNGTAFSGGLFNGSSGLINGGWTQSGGTFSTTGNMNVYALTLTGGTFNAPLGTLALFAGFSHTGGGTFNARTGTVQTSNLPGVYGMLFDVNSSETFNNLKFHGTDNNANHVIGTGDTLIVNGTLTFAGRGVNGSSIVANGNVIYDVYGGYQNATTLVKFQDSATRTLTFCNDGAGCGGVFLQPTLVNNPNITLNVGVNNAGLPVYWESLNLQQGTVNAGNNIASFNQDFTQSGGTYNGGNVSNTLYANFTLSGGDFNAAATTSFAGNFTHTSGGNFNYGAGIVNLQGSTGIVDVATNENFNNLNFRMNGGNTKTIASGDTLTVNGITNFQSGYINGGTIDAKGNVSVSAAFTGGNSALTFSGAGTQTYTNTGGITTNGIWTVNKPDSLSTLENSFAPAAPANLLLSGNVGNNASSTFVPLNIVSGNVLQTGNFNNSLASLNMAAGTSFVNDFGGTLTLNGNVLNEGSIRFNASGTGCQADTLLVRSSNATQRNWTGSGFFQMIDTDVSGQSSTPIITVYSGTNSGNNGPNWVFDSNCLVPTAANVSIGGRIMQSSGRGIANVRIVLTDSDGNSRVALSNPFGYYGFSEVAAGQTVVISVNSKRFTFVNPTQILTISEELSNLNFTGDETR